MPKRQNQDVLQNPIYLDALSKRKKYKSDEEKEYYELKMYLNISTKIKDFEGALDSIVEMKKKKFPITSNMYSQLICIADPIKNKDHILLLSHEIIDDKMILFENCYSVLIKLLCLSDNYDRAVDIFTLMKNNKISPRTRTYIPLIEKAYMLKNTKHLEGYFEDLMSRQVSAPEEIFLYLILNSKREGDNEKCLMNIDRLNDYYPSVSESFARIITDCFKLNKCELSDDGECTVCKKCLKSIDLDEEEREALIKSIFGLMSFSEGRKMLVQQFEDYLSTHKYDVFVDSANIGFYQQNFEGGDFNFSQIDAIYVKLTEYGYNPLLLIHKSHMLEENEYIKKWRAKCCVYEVESGNNDDWYWMYSSLKTNTKFVSNDLMRDHYFQITYPKSFLKWRERNQIKFTFAAEAVLLKEPKLYFPLKYSSRNQIINNEEHLFVNGLENETVLYCINLLEYYFESLTNKIKYYKTTKNNIYYKTISL